MKYIQYAIAKRETGNASGKAKKDAFDIALQMGFEPSYQPSSQRIIRVLQQMTTLPKFSGNKVIFFQYPAVSELLMGLFKKVVSTNSSKIALVHDLSSIQGLVSQTQKKEAGFLNIFDCLIVHNAHMAQYVREIGYKGCTVNLDLFDYLHDASHSITNLPFSNSVSFAGNLGKARFLTDIGKIENCNFILYGSKGDMDFSSIPNAIYKGLLPSDEIQYLMEGDYSLVWDGDSIQTCAGPNGQYLRYNNPHKLSLSIAAGKPVITWKQAAIADFVNKYKIGITVESLEELNDIDLSNGYEEMRQNVLRIKKDIAVGNYLKIAIKQALDVTKGQK